MALQSIAPCAEESYDLGAVSIPTMQSFLQDINIFDQIDTCIACTHHHLVMRVTSSTDCCSYLLPFKAKTNTFSSANLLQMVLPKHFQKPIPIIQGMVLPDPPELLQVPSSPIHIQKIHLYNASLMPCIAGIECQLQHLEKS